MSSRFFSDNYAQARQRFYDAIRAANGRLDSITLNAFGPNGLPLSIDIGWLGARKPRQLILHQSGVHGVEGFAGSAIQLKLLAEPPVMGADTALVLVHILNPYGMAWLRRANEHNVDLNRNCLIDGETWSGAAEGYHKLNGLINPTTPPALDCFAFRALLSILRYGFSTLKQAIALGQYDYPNGLFYGGRKLEQGPALYQNKLIERLKFLQQILVIDVHTGLGKWGQQTLFLEVPRGERPLRELALQLDSPIIQSDQGIAPGYRIRGSLAQLFTQSLGQDWGVYLVQELGTYPALKVVHALREENRAHLLGETALNHPAKRRLKSVMIPTSERWRRQILRHGVELVKKGITIGN